MIDLTWHLAAQLVVAISVIYVWIFKYDNIVEHFIQFNLSSLMRNVAGVAKIAIATLLITGIWYNELVNPAALGMAFMMLVAQYYHFKTGSSLIKKLPSFILLVLSLFIVFS